MKDYCNEIGFLWGELNINMRVQGCQIDVEGVVHLWVWFTRSQKVQPMEIVIGKPARRVYASLKDAYNLQERGKRLEKRAAMAVRPNTIISDETGISTSGDDGTGDK